MQRLWSLLVNNVSKSFDCVGVYASDQFDFIALPPGGLLERDVCLLLDQIKPIGPLVPVN